MEENIFFRFAVPTILFIFILHRGYYVKTRTKPDAETIKERQADTTSRVAGILGLIGFLSVVVYTAFPQWMEFASTSAPNQVRWIGIGIATLGFGLLQWGQTVLGDSWSDTPRMMKGQSLITRGPYKFIRHPIYTAFILILGSLLLISANWLVGLSWLSMVIFEVTARMKSEEKLMIEFFGDSYRDYITRTGRLFPKLI